MNKTSNADIRIDDQACAERLRKRILVISHDRLPKLGGVSIMMHHCANALQRIGVDVDFAPPPEKSIVGYRHQYRFVGADAPQWARVRFLRRLLTGNPRTKALAKALEREVYDYVLFGDAVYGNSGVDYVPLLRQRRIPFGIICYGTDIRRLLLGHSPTPAQRVRDAISLGTLSETRLARSMLQKAQNVFAISSYTASLCQEFARVTPSIIGCGIELDILTEEAKRTPIFSRKGKKLAQAKFGLNTKFIVNYTGRITPRKNVKTLMLSVSQIPDAGLLLVGSGAFRQELERYGNELGITDRISFLGQVSEAQKWNAMRCSDVLCLPSLETQDGGVEGFGIVLLESGAVGTPVCAAASGGMTDVVLHGKTGISWDCKSAHSLSVAIRSLLEDDELSQSCVQGLRSAIRQKFNWEHVASKIAEGAGLTEQHHDTQGK